MEIEEDNPQRLILADPQKSVAGRIILSIAALWLFVGVPLAYDQNGLLIAILAAAATALPIAWGVLILRGSRVTFDAGKKVMEIKRAVFLKPSSWTVPFDQFEELYVLQTSDPEGGTGYQPVIATRDGTVQLSLAVFGEKEAEANIDVIARFLEGVELKVPRAASPKRMTTKSNRAKDS